MSEPQMFAANGLNLSAAWAEAFLKMCEPPERELSPFLISIAAGPDGSVQLASATGAIDSSVGAAAAGSAMVAPAIPIM